jgi:hypothetical protein
MFHVFFTHTVISNQLCRLLTAKRTSVVLENVGERRDGAHRRREFNGPAT